MVMKPAVLDTLTIAPEPRAIIPRAAAPDKTRTARTMTSKPAS